MRSPVRASILPDRGRATAPDDPVGGAARLPPIPIAATLCLGTFEKSSNDRYSVAIRGKPDVSRVSQFGSE
jgi:hypothetical protein